MEGPAPVQINKGGRAKGPLRGLGGIVGQNKQQCFFRMAKRDLVLTSRPKRGGKEK